MKIGKIISVEYDKFRVRLFHTTKTSTITIQGHVYYFGNIGSYLKTYNSTGDFILCEVIAVVDYNVESKTYSMFNLDSSRELVIKPIGTLDNNGMFCMGVGIYPSLYNDVDIVTIDDMNNILSFRKDENYPETIHQNISLGTSKNMINYHIKLDIDRFFNIHTAVLGNSGSGKSNTIAHLLQEVLRKKDNHANGAKFILYDVNGEYDKAFIETQLSKDIIPVFYKLSAEEDNSGKRMFQLPYYLMNLEEWLAFLMASDRVQKPFWNKVLQETYKFFKILNSTDTAGKERFCNYFKWKVLNLLNIVASQVDSDTARMTAARSVIKRCSELIQSLDAMSVSHLMKFLNDADSKCGISFGDNKEQLIDFIKDENGKVDIESALVIDNEKLRSGEFYDYKFLEAAVELVLIEEEARGNQRIREFTSTLLSRLDFFINNIECAFMRDNSKQFANVNDYLDSIFNIGIKERKNQLIIIDTSEADNEVLELTTSVISRMIFDYRKKQKNEARRYNPVHLILDEAHRYIRKDGNYILQENIFERIAREGRKYSLYLLISSQRPSELSSTVLSQCGNYIVHRIQNEMDMKYIYTVLPYFSEDYITKIKQQVPGEALVFGNCVPMPLQIKIIQATPDPNSENCKIKEQWFGTAENDEIIDEVLHKENQLMEEDEEDYSL